MEAPALRSKRGFTLIEVLIAMLALLIGLLGSLAATMAALEYNLSNDLRNEAMKIAQEQLERARNSTFGGLDVGKTDQTVTRTIRKAPRDFNIERTVWATGQIKRLTITIKWKYKKDRTYTVETIVRNPL